MMQSFFMMVMQSSSIKVLHHESGVLTASLSESTPPLMACKWPSGRKPWPPYLMEVVSHGPNLWTSGGFNVSQSRLAHVPRIAH